MTPFQLRESYRAGWSAGVASAGQYQLGEADDKLAFDRGFAVGRQARLAALRQAIELWPDGIPGLQPPASPVEMRAAELPADVRAWGGSMVEMPDGSVDMPIGAVAEQDPRERARGAWADWTDEDRATEREARKMLGVAGGPPRGDFAITVHYGQLPVGFYQAVASWLGDDQPCVVEERGDVLIVSAALSKFTLDEQAAKADELVDRFPPVKRVMMMPLASESTRRQKL